MDKLFVPAEEAFESLGIGRTKGFEFIKSGELRSVKVGRKRLVPTAGVREFADRLLEQAGDPA